MSSRRSYTAGLREEQAQLTRTRILAAAAQLFVDRGYSNVTVEDIAKDAGVAYQTVYSAFGNKLAVARGVIWSSFETEGIYELLEEAQGSGDLELSFRIGARISRRLNQRFAAIVRFLRESGDPALLAEYHKIEALRFEQLREELSGVLQKSTRLRKTVSPADALATIWALTGTDFYNQLVSARRWTPARYEDWLKDALTKLLLQPRRGGTPE